MWTNHCNQIFQGGTNDILVAENQAVTSQNVGCFLKLGWIQSNFNIILKNLKRPQVNLKVHFHFKTTSENSLLSSLLTTRDGEEQEETAVFSSYFKNTLPFLNA